MQKITIIIAVYNRKSEISACLDSVIKQSYGLWELIVIDGGSDDGTLDVIESYSEFISYFHSGPDSGIASAWNHALTHATGDWYLFLGSDDRLYNGDVLLDAAHKLQDTDSDFIYGSVTLLDPSKDVILGEQFDRNKLKRRMTIPHMGCFHSAGIFAEYRFNEQLSISIDYDLMVNNLDKSFRFIDIPITVAGNNGVSVTNKFIALTENFLIQRKSKEIAFFLPYISLFYYFAREKIKEIVGRVINSS